MDAKPFYMSKTFWVNVVGGLVIILGSPELAAVLPAWTQPYTALAVFAINVYLRSGTTGPLTLTSAAARRRS